METASPQELGEEAAGVSGGRSGSAIEEPGVEGEKPEGDDAAGALAEEEMLGRKGKGDCGEEAAGVSGGRSGSVIEEPGVEGEKPECDDAAGALAEEEMLGRKGKGDCNQGGTTLSEDSALSRDISGCISVGVEDEMENHQAGLKNEGETSSGNGDRSCGDGSSGERHSEVSNGQGTTRSEGKVQEWGIGARSQCADVREEVTLLCEPDSNRTLAEDMTTALPGNNTNIKTQKDLDACSGDGDIMDKSERKSVLTEEEASAPQENDVTKGWQTIHQHSTSPCEIEKVIQSEPAIESHERTDPMKQISEILPLDVYATNGTTGTSTRVAENAEAKVTKQSEPISGAVKAQVSELIQEDPNSGLLDESSVSLGEAKSCGDECDGDIDRVFSHLKLKTDSTASSDEESFQDVSGIERDASSSLDSTANTNTPRPPASCDISSTVDHQAFGEEAHSSSGEDCVSSKARPIPHPKERPKNRIDLHHQFVREIVKIQQDRDQYEKQWQAAQQGASTGSGGVTLQSASPVQIQERKRGSEVPSRKHNKRESNRIGIQELVMMSQGVALDTVSMAPERHVRGGFQVHGDGTQEPITGAESRISLLASPRREAGEREASQSSKGLKKENSHHEVLQQRGKETAGKQQRFGPIYRPPSARDSVDDNDSNKDSEELNSSLQYLTLSTRQADPLPPPGSPTPLSPAPAGFSQFRGGLAGGPRATKGRGGVSPVINTMHNERHVQWVETHVKVPTLPSESLGIKVTFDTANQVRHIEYSDPATIVVTVSERGRTSRVVSHGAPVFGIGTGRNNQQMDTNFAENPSTPVAGLFHKVLPSGVAGDVPSGFQFKATPTASHIGNGAGMGGRGMKPAGTVDRSKEIRPTGIKNQDREPGMVPSREGKTRPYVKLGPSAKVERGTLAEGMSSVRREAELIKGVERLHVNPNGQRNELPWVDPPELDGVRGGVALRLVENRPPRVVVGERGANPITAHIKWGDVEDSPEVQESLPHWRTPHNEGRGLVSHIADVLEATSGSISHGRSKPNIGQEVQEDSGSLKGSFHPGPIRGHHSPGSSGPRKRESRDSNPCQPGKVHSEEINNIPQVPIPLAAETHVRKSVWERLGPQIGIGNSVPRASSAVACPPLRTFDAEVDLPRDGSTGSSAKVRDDTRGFDTMVHNGLALKGRRHVADYVEGTTAETDLSFSNGEDGEGLTSKDMKQKRSKMMLYVPRRGSHGP